MVEECDKCGKSFKSKEALEQHLEDYDHSKNEEEKIGLKEKLMTSNLAGFSIIAILVVGTGFLAVSALSSGGSGTGSASVDTVGEPVKGSQNASVTIAYFGDYNCSACLMFEQRVFPTMETQMLGDDVKFVKKNFPVINSQSPQLAQASQSVWEQTKDSNPDAFWEWHATMYDNQGGYGTNWATQNRIIEITQGVEGVNASKVEQDLETGEYGSEVQEDLSEGQSVGVTGTPTFIIFSEETGESTQLVGPQPVSEFRNAVNSVSS
jgi:protein-disulfide isomerase